MWIAVILCLGCLGIQETEGYEGVAAARVNPTDRTSLHQQQALEVTAPRERKAQSPKPFLDLTQPETSSTSGDAALLTDDGQSLGEIIGGVVGVIALFGLVILVLRRLSRTTSKQPGGTRQGRVIETLTLGLRGELSLIEIGGVRVLVGCDRTGLKVIGFPPSPFSELMDDELETPPYSRRFPLMERPLSESEY